MTDSRRDHSPGLVAQECVNGAVGCAGPLLETLRALFSTLSVAEVAHRLLNRVREHANADVVLLYLADDSARIRLAGCSEGSSFESSVGSAISEHGIIADMLHRRESLRLEQVTFEVDPRVRDSAEADATRQASLLCVPLCAAELPPGALALLRNQAAEPFGPVDEQCVRRVSEFAEIALANAHCHEGLMEVAQHDPLTGLANHGHFWSILTAEMSRAHRYGRQLSLVMIDVDHFKDYNDTRGHLGGDQALVQVARCIEGRCRASDLAARYGGDEFAAILPETPLVGALSFGEKIRSGVDQLGLCAVTGERLTVSVGVANFPSDAQSAADLARISDEQLYRAKAKGRNCVCGRGYESR